MSIKAVIGASCALLAALVLFLLLDSDQRRSGGNHTPEFGPVTELDGQATWCQDGELVPGDTGALRVLVGTHGPPTPELTVRVTEPGGQLITSGLLAPGKPQGKVTIPVNEVSDTVTGVEVCISTGRSDRTVLYGRGDRVRLDWMRPGSESRVAMATTVAHRFGLAKLNPFGPWLLAVVALLVLAACFVAVRLTARELGP